MAHIGIMSMAVEGRTFPLIAIGLELQERGHDVTVIGHELHQRLAKDAGLSFLPVISPERYKRYGTQYPNSIKRPIARLMLAAGKRLLPKEYKDADGLKALAVVACSYGEYTKADFMCVDSIFREAGFDAIVASDTSYASTTIAEHHKIPCYSVCTGVPIVNDISVPPDFVPWRYSDASWAKLRNWFAWAFVNLLNLPSLLEVNAWRQIWGLEEYSHLSQTTSSHLYISQMPDGLNFPTNESSTPIKYLGLLQHTKGRKSIEFPWNRLDDRPTVYASTGTLCQAEDVLRCVAEACSDLPVNLIITRGGSQKLQDTEEIPGNPIVVDYAPQLEVLKRTSLTITHGSLNTIAESIQQGVPLIVIPLVFDQPGTGARVTWCGAGVAIDRKKLSVELLRKTIQRVLSEKSYRERAMQLKDASQLEGGTARAVDLIEAALSELPKPAATPIAVSPRKPSKAQAEPPTEFSVTTPDKYCLKGLRYQAEGLPDKSTAICIHGFGCDVTSTELMAKVFQANGINAVTIDLRGHGLSAAGGAKGTVIEKTNLSLDPVQNAKDIVAVCDDLAIDRAFLASQSFGGLVGLELLKADEERKRFEALFAFAPPFVAKREPLSNLIHDVYGGVRLLSGVGAHTGFSRKRILLRKDYPKYSNTPDINIVRMIQECRTVSWNIYARFLMRTKISLYWKPPNWSKKKQRHVHLFAARYDMLWGANQLEAVSKAAEWPLQYMPFGHLDIATSEECAEQFVQRIIAAR